MSEPVVRFRRTPKAPFIGGNILLAALGVSLVFFGSDPWSLTTVLLVVLCLAIGGILTLLPFLLDQFAWLNHNRSRVAQASVNLRGALEKADDLLEELQARKVEENPLRIVSERLPDLVEEKLGEAVERNLKQTDERPSEILRQLEPLAGLTKDLERLHDDVRVLSSHAATREYVETGMTRLSEEILRIEAKLDELRRVQLYGTPVPPEDPPKEATEPNTTAAKTASAPVETATPPTPEHQGPPPEGPPPENPPEEATADKPTQETPPDEPLEEPPEDEPPATPPEEEGEEEEPPPETEAPAAAETTQPEPVATPKRKSSKTKATKIIVSAFVGIQNGIYLHGEGPGFPAEGEQRLDMTGIGEWIWSSEIAEPFTAELFLNNNIPSDIGTFTVTPGDVLKLNPSFPQEKKK